MINKETDQLFLDIKDNNHILRPAVWSCDEYDRTTFPTGAASEMLHVAVKLITRTYTNIFFSLFAQFPL